MQITFKRCPTFAPVGFLIMPVGEEDPENSVLVDSDWDYPALAEEFGWPGYPANDGHTESEYIAAAAEWLYEHAGDADMVVDDPGYFDCFAY